MELYRKNPGTLGKILQKPSKIKEQWEKMGKNSRVDWEL
jgi:hypothetical protein